MFKFDDTHTVTYGKKSFISRNKELDHLYQHIFEVVNEEREKVNYSITGINRIGKTSLIKELCRRFDEEPHPDTFVLFTSLEGVKSFWPFWCGKVVMPLMNSLNMEEVKAIDEDYYEQIAEIRGYFEDREVREHLYVKDCDIVEQEEAKENLELFLSLLGYCGKHVLLIIDEFDLAARAFGENDAFFDWFRGLLQEENHPLSVITISRRSIYYIETNAFGGSTLSGTFKSFWVFGYRNREIEEYFNLLEKNGCSLTQEQKRDVVYYCGRSPYYLAIMGNAILESKSEKGIPNIGTLFKRERRYHDSFGKIVDTLRAEKLYETMLQLFVGPQYDLEQDKIAELIGNGYCMKKDTLLEESQDEEYHDIYGTYEKKYSYLTVCNSFIEYLKRQKKKDVENIFPALSKAEERLRSFIREHMEERYNDEWKKQIHELLFQVILKNDKVRKAQLDQFHERFLRQREEADNPSETDDSILNVVSIFELGAIMLDGWDEYKDNFPSWLTPKEFEKGMSLLNKVRNPVAHGNGKIVPHDEVVRAREFAEKICSALSDVRHI